MPEARNAESIFHEARRLPVQDRSRYLAQACGNEADLRARVEALLAADADAGSFLAAADPNPTIPKSAAISVTERPGQIIGRFKLLQQIGEGGFGSVWMAEQREP